MGIYLNPGNERFQESLDSRIYVDKSGLISHTNRVFRTQDKYLCVSRPRRFGKTMALDMLAAYYGRGCDSRRQFENLEIARKPEYERHMNRYDVIKVSMQNFLVRGGNTVKGAIALLEGVIKRELADAYPASCADGDLPLSMWLERVYSATGVPFVMLVDEWDCVMRDMRDDEGSQKLYLDWLGDLLKDAPYLGLAYMTGILPVKKYGGHSALNMFEEISILNARPISESTGFTESEVAELCAEFGADVGEMQRWYDGYDVDGFHVYNPRSVVQALVRGAYGNYWARTETFEALRRYIMLDMDGLRQKVARLVAGDAIAVNTDKFQNDMTTFGSADDVLTLLVHLGYLTYDSPQGTVRVPNSEVAQEFVSSIEDDGDWKPVVDAIAASDNLMEATLAGDAARVAELVERSHEDNASLLRYNDENSLACVLSLAYYTVRRTHRIEREVPAGKGFADLVFRPRPGVDAPAMVVELKAGRSAGEAISQIREKGYARALAEYSEILLVGISYNPDATAPSQKHHECVIERA